MIQVLVRFNNVDSSLRVLKREMQREGIFKVIKAKRYFIKPSELRLLKRDEARRRQRKIDRKRYS